MFEVLYDPHVLNDLKKLNRAEQQKILTQIHKKLTAAPLEFGKPLRHALKGYWRLRVADYRVIYEVDNRERRVIVWFVDQRKDDQVYIEFIKKIKKP